jgi:hypothetical protein
MIARLVRLPRIAPLLAVLLLAPASLGQDALGATRKQKISLQPLIELLTESFELQCVTLDAKDIERGLGKALSVQVTWKAYSRYKDEVTRLIAVDLGIDTTQGHLAIEKNLFDVFGESPTEVEAALILPELPDVPTGGDDEARKAAREEREKVKLLELTMERRLDEVRYPPVKVDAHHKQCMAHDALTIMDIKTLLQSPLDKEQERGMKELADYYAPLFAALFGVEDSPREYRKRFEAALASPHTERALAAVLVKLRLFARPLVYAEERVGDDPYSIIDVQPKVIDMVVSKVGSSELWDALRSDHVDMLEDAKAHRRAFKERIKGQ